MDRCSKRMFIDSEQGEMVKRTFKRCLKCGGKKAEWKPEECNNCGFVMYKRKNWEYIFGFEDIDRPYKIMVIPNGVLAIFNGEE